MEYVACDSTIYGPDDPNHEFPLSDDGHGDHGWRFHHACFAVRIFLHVVMLGVNFFLFLFVIAHFQPFDCACIQGRSLLLLKSRLLNTIMITILQLLGSSWRYFTMLRYLSSSH